MKTLILPKSYHDPATFAKEQQVLWGRFWICVGFTRELAGHNDFISRNVGGYSIIVQNFGGSLRAFYNVCSHRFNRIHALPGGNAPLKCGYHGWTYDEGGIPVAIPKRPRFDDLTPEKLCELKLRSCRVDVCGTLVFVCRQPVGPSLSEFLGDSQVAIDSMTKACGPQIDENTMSIRANWKVLIENTLESYHVGFVHPNTFSRLNAGEGTFKWQPPHSSWEAPLGSRFTTRLAKVMGFFETRPLKFDGYRHQLVFPHVTIASTQGTSFSVQFFEPIGPDETKFTSFVFRTKLDNPTPTAATAVEMMDSSIKEFNRAVFSEDKQVCEQVQLGIQETNVSGLLSDEELRVGDFQAHYHKFMQDEVQT